MADEYRKAQRGNGKARLILFDSVKQKIWVLSCALLQDDSAAEAILPVIFKEAGHLLNDSTITGQPDFEHVLLCRSAVLCRRSVVQKAPEVFRISGKDNRMVCNVPEDGLTDNGLQNLLLCLPPLRRFVLTLRFEAGLDGAEIAEIMEMRKAEIKNLLTEEPELLSKVYNQLKMRGVRAVPPTGPLLADAFSMAETLSPIPEGTEDLARSAFLDGAPRPVKKGKGIYRKVILISLAVIMLASAIAFVVIHHKSVEIQTEAAARAAARTTESDDAGSVSVTAADQETADSEDSAEATDDQPVG